MSISKIKTSNFGYRTYIEFPYTAPSDGFIHVDMNPSTESGGLLRVNEDNGSVHAITAPTGSLVSLDFAVKVGTVLTLVKGTEYGTVVSKFMPNN